MNFIIFKKLKKQILWRSLSFFYELLNIFVFKLVNKFLKSKNLYIVFLREERIGHQAGNADIEFCKAYHRKINNNSKTIFIFPFKLDHVANLELRKRLISFASKNSYKTIVLNHKYLTKVFSKILINGLPRVFKSCQNIYYSDTDTGPRISAQVLKTSKTHNILCKKLEINPKNYICITSRDENYLRSLNKKRNWDYHNYRNTDIDNLKGLSLYVQKELNMDVVRIGSYSKKRIKWESEKNPKIIDYSFSTYCSPKNDIELIAGCNLFINNGGGPVAAAIAARRNIITINHIPIRISIGNVWGLWIPKLLKLKKNNKFLSLRETEKLGLAESLNSEDYTKANIEIFENTEEDIVNAIKDYFKIKKGLIDYKENAVLKRYKEIRDESAHIFRKNIVPNDKDIISPSFLLKYPELLS